MARNRMIKKDFYEDEKIAKLSVFARYLFVGLWVIADDGGTCRGNKQYIKSMLFPYDNIDPEEIEKAITEMNQLGIIRRVEYKKERFIIIKNFSKHQRINKPSSFRYIDLREVEEDELKEIDGAFEEENKKPKKPKKESNKSKKEKRKEHPRYEEIKEIIDYLNSKIGTQFKPTTANTQAEIGGRLSEGFTVEEFKRVIDIKVEHWKDDKKMKNYLVPKTLFRESNFENYLNQANLLDSENEDFY